MFRCLEIGSIHGNMSGILVSLMGFYFVQMGMILDEQSTPIAVIAILPSAHRVEPLQGVNIPHIAAHILVEFCNCWHASPVNLDLG
jgi:hypothetical protein